jgi:hypothetical protein
MVTIQITVAQMRPFSGNECLRGDFVVKQLRKAGVPVIGVLWPRGANGGKLTMECQDDGGLVFTYDGKVQAPEEEQLW